MQHHNVCNVTTLLYLLGITSRTFAILTMCIFVLYPLWIQKKYVSLPTETPNNLYIDIKQVDNYYDKINELAERIVSGRTQFGRENMPGWREALTTAQVGAEIISAERGGISAAVSICSVEDRSIRRPIEDAVENWAKSSGIWLQEEDIYKLSFNGEMFSRGSESRVYLSADRKLVTKYIDPYQRNDGGLFMALRNISIFNHLFPDAAYKVVGYSRDTNDRFRIVVEQPFIFGREYSFEDYLHLGVESRIVNMFAEIGMEPVESDTTTFANDKYYVKDVHYGNVIEQKDGKLVIIDANATYNEGYKRELFNDNEFDMNIVREE